MFNKTKKQNPQSRIAQLLGTNNPDEQAARIGNLLAQPGLQVLVTMSITGELMEVMPLRGKVEAAEILRALMAGQQFLMDALAQAKAQQPARATKAESAPPVPGEGAPR